MASPTYKGVYSGLLKSLFDGVPTGDLVGCVAIPVMLVGSLKHAHACGSHLRPLLEEVGALVPLPGLAVLEDQLDDVESVMERWWESSGWVYERLVDGRSSTGCES